MPLSPQLPSPPPARSVALEPAHHLPRRERRHPVAILARQRLLDPQRPLLVRRRAGRCAAPPAASAAISRASAIASGSACPFGTMRFARPMRSASSPRRRRGPSGSCRARGCARSVARGAPSRRPSAGCPSAGRRRRRLRPPPPPAGRTRPLARAPPRRRAPQPRRSPACVSIMRVGPTGPSPSGVTGVMRAGSPLRIALRSAPQQNLPPAPASTATDELSGRHRSGGTPPPAPPPSAGRSRSPPPAGRS